jgi:hypothetical protein
VLKRQYYNIILTVKLFLASASFGTQGEGTTEDRMARRSLLGIPAWSYAHSNYMTTRRDLIIHREKNA